MLGRSGICGVAELLPQAEGPLAVLRPHGKREASGRCIEAQTSTQELTEIESPRRPTWESGEARSRRVACAPMYGMKIQVTLLRSLRLYRNSNASYTLVVRF